MLARYSRKPKAGGLVRVHELRRFSNGIPSWAGTGGAIEVENTAGGFDRDGLIDQANVIDESLVHAGKTLVARFDPRVVIEEPAPVVEVAPEHHRRAGNPGGLVGGPGTVQRGDVVAAVANPWGHLIVGRACACQVPDGCIEHRPRRLTLSLSVNSPQRDLRVLLQPIRHRRPHLVSHPLVPEL